ncbi:hypothetical protein I3A86_23945 [Salmonella enterica]|nr:hypothetical protein [Salmonella enterica]
MIFEMNQSKLERLFLLPKLKGMIADNNKGKMKEEFSKTGEYFGLSMALGIDRSVKGQEIYRFMPLEGNDKYSFVHLLRWLYPAEMWPTEKQGKSFNDKDDAFVRKLMKGGKYTEIANFNSILFSSRDPLAEEMTRDGWKLEPLKEISECGFDEYMAFMWNCLEKLTKIISQRLRTTQKTIDEILNI